MALLRRINWILLTLLALIVCTILYKGVHRSHQRSSHIGPVPSPVPLDVRHEASEVQGMIPVVICAAKERVGTTMATINSVSGNTDASLLFYIITLQDAVQHVKDYIENSALKDIKYKIVEFNPMTLKGKVRPDSARPDLLHPLNFARFYLPLLVNQHKRVIYLDDDVIVQGDIQDLYQTRLEPGHAAAFASDCDLPSTHEMVRSIGMQTTYMGFLDYRKQEVRDLGINPNDCSFNPGVFVADVEEWRRQKITKQLEKWMQQNFRDNLYSSAMAGGVATPPMLIVFYRKYTALPPLWHVRHLGWSPNTRYPERLLEEAHLLHWNGRFKPWDYPSVHRELWEKWYIPDPTEKFLLVRPNR
ncbi:glycosyltransferase 8 domain-containing protein 2 [Brienomyrus brachyistius]|uniref:glycosyltransferase 8 domain-containing protein 2 n=1 Tax=Brienomyrus brachyistius TaxID=42636 RepID=UPI0020B41637|nr:glycosyltransferase 8 domain-containing protein 2 [Brienomyrus brachyistius]